MSTFFLIIGITSVALGSGLLAWGAIGRFFDKHTYSEDDGAAMFYGSIIACWGVALLAVALAALLA